MAARIKSLAALKRRHSPLEKDVLREVLGYLADAGVMAWRTNAGAQYVGGRKIQLAPGGASDVFGCLPGGRFLSIELKRPKGGRLSEAQKNWLDMVNRLGGLAFVATSALAVYGALRAEGYDVAPPRNYAGGAP